MEDSKVVTIGEWPVWNIHKTSPPVVTMEGYDIQSVLSMIHTQLHTLRGICVDQAHEIEKLKLGSKKSKDLVTNLNDKVAELKVQVIQQQQQIQKQEQLMLGQPDESGNEINFAVLNQRVEVIESTLQSSDSLSGVNSELEQQKSKLQALERRMENIWRNAQSREQTTEKLENKLEKLNNQNTTVVEEMKEVRGTINTIRQGISRAQSMERIFDCPSGVPTSPDELAHSSPVPGQSQSTLTTPVAATAGNVNSVPTLTSQSSIVHSASDQANEMMSGFSTPVLSLPGYVASRSMSDHAPVVSKEAGVGQTPPDSSRRRPMSAKTRCNASTVIGTPSEDILEVLPEEERCATEKLGAVHDGGIDGVRPQKEDTCDQRRLADNNELVATSASRERMIVTDNSGRSPHEAGSTTLCLSPPPEVVEKSRSHDQHQTVNAPAQEQPSALPMDGQVSSTGYHGDMWRLEAMIDNFADRLRNVETMGNTRHAEVMEQIKTMKQKWNRKFQSMHEWVKGKVGAVSGGGKGGGNEAGEETDYTVSIFQCPECFRISRMSLGGCLSACDHKVLSRSSIDLPPIDKIDPKYRLDYRPNSQSGEMWWNMIPR